MPSRLFFSVKNQMSTQMLVEGLGDAFRRNVRVVNGTYVGRNTVRVNGTEYAISAADAAGLSEGAAVALQNSGRPAAAIYTLSDAPGTVTTSTSGSASTGLTVHTHTTDDEGGSLTSYLALAGGTMSGALGRPIASKTTTYTLTANDYVILCSGTFTVTLPTAAAAQGRMYQVKNIDTGVITLDGDGSETIEGDTTQTLAQWDSITVVSNGSAWYIL